MQYSRIVFAPYAIALMVVTAAIRSFCRHAMGRCCTSGNSKYTPLSDCRGVQRIQYRELFRLLQCAAEPDRRAETGLWLSKRDLCDKTIPLGTRLQF